MGVYIWLGGKIVPMGQADGPVVTPPSPTRARVSRLKATTGSGAAPTPYVNPRNSLTIGQYNPRDTTIANHGKVYGTLEQDPLAPARVPFQGDFTCTSNNQIVENLEIFGSINTRAFTNVTVRNCTVYGPPSTSSWWGTLRGPIYSSSSQMNGLLVEDTLRRVEISNHQDGPSFTSTTGNVTIEGSYLHDALFSEFSQAQVDSGEHPAGGSNYTHCDGLQWHVGKNYLIRGNFIGGVREPWDHHIGREAEINSGDDWYNAALMIKQEVSNAEANFIDNVIIENNWLWGGASTVNITSPGASASGPKNYMVPKDAADGRPARVGVIIRNNTFLRSTWEDKLKTRLNSDGNIMEPSGQAYVLRDLNMGVFQNNTFPDGVAVPIRSGGNYP